MIKKFYNGFIYDTSKNGFIYIGAKKIGVSNLPQYLFSNLDIAHDNNYYEYLEDDVPEYNKETQYLEIKYELVDNIIHKTYVIKDIPVEETEETEE